MQRRKSPWRDELAKAEEEVSSFFNSTPVSRHLFVEMSLLPLSSGRRLKDDARIRTLYEIALEFDVTHC